MSKLTRRLLNPITRTAILAFAWQHRHEIMRWGRSLWTELRGAPNISPARLRIIGSVLWRITTERELSEAPQLRRVRVVGDRVEVDVDQNWKHTARLLTLLGGISGVSNVVANSGASGGLSAA